MNVLDQINQEKNEFEWKDIQIVPGYSFNQKTTIETCYFYYNSKFKTGDTDSQGNRKYFFNIVKNPCKVTTKAVDFDTKHIDVQTAPGGDPLRTWYFERDLKFWMKDKNFGKVLNRIFEELPIFGSCVIKMVGDEPHFVDLRNFIVEQAADKLDNASYIIEVHNYNPPEFKKVAKEMGWDPEKVKEAVALFRQMKDTAYITVYERYGEMQEIKDGEDGEYAYRRIFVADVGETKQDKYGNKIPRPGIVLKDEKWEGHPYFEFHLEKIPGRWLGIGVVEVLEEAQIRHNEIANLQARGSHWAALRIFQTRDEAANRNLLTDVDDGEVLNVDSEITQIAMDERNLAFFNQETQKWITNRDELTFAYDVIQGERLPAGTPLGSARIAATMAGSHFDQVRENIALDIKRFLYKGIIPTFQKQNSAEHTVRLVGEDLDTYVTMIKGQLVLQEVIKEAVRSLAGRRPFPINEDKDLITLAIEENLKKGREKLVTIPKDFYKNLKYKINIIITGEEKDTRVWAATLFAALQAITTDPTILSDPVKKRIFGKWLEAGGLNLSDIEPEATPTISEKLEETATPRSVGGGVSRPSMPTAPMPGLVEKTL